MRASWRLSRQTLGSLLCPMLLCSGATSPVRLSRQWPHLYARVVISLGNCNGECARGQQNEFGRVLRRQRYATRLSTRVRLGSPQGRGQSMKRVLLVGVVCAVISECAGCATSSVRPAFSYYDACSAQTS